MAKNDLLPEFATSVAGSAQRGQPAGAELRTDTGLAAAINGENTAL